MTFSRVDVNRRCWFWWIILFFLLQRERKFAIYFIQSYLMITFILLFFFITFLKILLFQHFFPFQSQKLRPDRIYFTWTYWHIFSLFLSHRELLVFCFFSYFFYLFFPSPFFLHKHHISQWEPHFHVFFLFSFFRFSVDRSF